MMQQIHSLARDNVKPALPRGGTWVFPPAQTYINPLDSILSGGGPSPRRPDGKSQQDIAGPQEDYIFYLIPVTLPFPPLTRLFRFCLFFSKFNFFFVSASNLVGF